VEVLTPLLVFEEATIDGASEHVKSIVWSSSAAFYSRSMEFMANMAYLGFHRSLRPLLMRYALWSAECSLWTQSRPCQMTWLVSNALDSFYCFFVLYTKCSSNHVVQKYFLC
jgi:hypothetical protein